MSNLLALDLESRLLNWGRWVRQGNAVRLGYPGVTVLARLVPRMVSSAWDPVDVDDAERVDGLVLRLDAADRQLIRLTYSTQKTTSEISRRLGVARSTYYRRLEVARAVLLSMALELKCEDAVRK